MTDGTSDAPDPGARDQPEHDQDSESTMTAPPEDRPDADASVLEPEGRAGNPDVTDADEPG
jgi:hypothetical protein